MKYVGRHNSRTWQGKKSSVLEANIKYLVKVSVLEGLMNGGCRGGPVMRKIMRCIKVI